MKVQLKKIIKVDSILVKLIFAQAFDCTKNKVILSLSFCSKNNPKFKYYSEVHCKKKGIMPSNVQRQ